MIIALKPDMREAFTRRELVLVLCLIFVLVFTFLPILVRDRPWQDFSKVSCISNLKQIGVGFRLFANDNDNKYPRFTNQFGTGFAWTNFAAVGNEITSPRVLFLCPKDRAKASKLNDSERWRDFVASDFSLLANGFCNPSHQESDLSYFYGTSADETKPNTLLAGDRNLSANMVAFPNGPDQSPRWSYAGRGEVLLGADKTGVPKPKCGWNSALHHFAGNILLGDGSVSQVTTPKLIEQLNKSDDPENRVIFPGPVGGP